MATAHGLANTHMARLNRDLLEFARAPGGKDPARPGGGRYLMPA